MSKDADERFWSKIDDSGGAEACWPWTGAVNDRGYGVFWHDGRFVKPHRLVLDALDSRLDVDHVCHNGTDCAGGKACMHRRCCNPAHLELVTRRSNLLRSHVVGRAKMPWKTHCFRGHAFDNANTYIDTTGHQRCRACARDYQKERRNRKKVAA